MERITNKDLEAVVTRINANRLCACWNACEGINPEAVPDLLEACKHAAASCHHPACKCSGEYSANPEQYCTCHVQKARAALAKAGG